VLSAVPQPGALRKRMLACIDRMLKRIDTVKQGDERNEFNAIENFASPPDHALGAKDASG